MNLKQVYEAVLTELNKENTNTITLEEFNYFANKSVYQKFNTLYGMADMNQQISDDLRPLKRNEVLTPKSNGLNIFILPQNYYHILNCIVVFESIIPSTCESVNYKSYSARRLTSDMYAGIINNYYFKPDVKRPYYNIEFDNELEIKYGDNKKYNIKAVSIDYLKSPDTLNLTLEQIDSYIGEQLEEPIQELEFPEYMCYEIINNIIKLFLENTSNPRIQTNSAINQSILPPMQMNTK